MNFRKILIFILMILGPIHARGAEPLDFNAIIRGINYEGLKNISPSQLPKITDLYTKVGRRLLENELSKDIDKLYLSGFFEEVSAQTITSRNRVMLQFNFKENAPVKEIRFIGNTIYNSADLKAAIFHKPGTVFNIKEVENDKTLILKKYHDAGYDFSKIATIRMKRHNILVFTVLEGEINKIQFSGLHALSPEICLRDMTLRKGSIFNSKTLRLDQDRLLKLGYFFDVSSPRLIASKGGKKVDITYEVIEKKVNRIDIGLEQEEENFVGFFQTNYNHSLIESDILSGKIQIGSDQNQYQINSYSARYSQPWILNKAPISFTADVWTELKQEYFSTTSDNSLGDLTKNRRIGWDVIFGFPISKEMLHFLLKVKQESVSPRDDDTSFSSYKLSSLSGILNFQSVDNWANPKKGSYWRFKFEKGGNLGITSLDGLDFTKLSLNAATFIRISEKNVLALHSDMGIFKPHGQESQTFEAEGFEIGGASTLRGYKDTPPLTGFRKIVFNLEFRHDWSKSFQGILFYDFGKVFNSGWNFQYDTFKQGKGFGFRFSTPVGAIRTDFAFGEQDFIIHFNLGQVF